MKEVRRLRRRKIWRSFCCALFDAARLKEFISLRALTAFATSIAAIALLSGCASELNRKAQHADGLFDFAFALAGREHAHIAPVEIVLGQSARITNAHAVADREQMLVYGYVQRIALVSPGRGAHVDVLLIGPDGKTIAHASDKYSSTVVSRRQHGGNTPRAMFIARLPLPPAGARVQVIHHGAPLSDCALQSSRPLL